MGLSSLNKVLVGGCFDVLHWGHIFFLKKAKKYGDILVVLLESDKSVQQLKGKNRPIHSQKKRKEMLLALRSVDEVIALKGILLDQDYERLIQSLKPQVIVATLGDPILEKKRVQAARAGIKFVAVKKLATPSTRELKIFL